MSDAQKWRNLARNFGAINRAQKEEDRRRQFFHYVRKVLSLLKESGWDFGIGSGTPQSEWKDIHFETAWYAVLKLSGVEQIESSGVYKGADWNQRIEESAIALNAIADQLEDREKGYISGADVARGFHWFLGGKNPRPDSAKVWSMVPEKLQDNGKSGRQRKIQMQSVLEFAAEAGLRFDRSEIVGPL